MFGKKESKKIFLKLTIWCACANVLLANVSIHGLVLLFGETGLRSLESGSDFVLMRDWLCVKENSVWGRDRLFRPQLRDRVVFVLHHIN